MRDSVSLELSKYSMAASSLPQASHSLVVCVIGSSLALAACGPAMQKPSEQALRDAQDTGTRTAGANNLEKAVLVELPSLPPESPRTIQGQPVVAGAAYFAASGRQCRQVTLGSSTGSSRRLACADEDGWFFVPDVFDPSAAR